MPWPVATSPRKHRLPRDWTTRRRAVLRRAGGRCEVPGCTAQATDVDHVAPGDDHGLGNLQALCRACHAQKSSAEGRAAQEHRRALRRRAALRHPGSTQD